MLNSLSAVSPISPATFPVAAANGVLQSGTGFDNTLLAVTGTVTATKAPAQQQRPSAGSLVETRGHDFRQTATRRNNEQSPSSVASSSSKGPAPAVDLSSTPVVIVAAMPAVSALPARATEEACDVSSATDPTAEQPAEAPNTMPNETTVTGEVGIRTVRAAGSAFASRDSGPSEAPAAGSNLNLTVAASPAPSPDATPSDGNPAAAPCEATGAKNTASSSVRTLNSAEAANLTLPAPLQRLAEIGIDGIQVSTAPAPASQTTHVLAASPAVAGLLQTNTDATGTETLATVQDDLRDANAAAPNPLGQAAAGPIGAEYPALVSPASNVPESQYGANSPEVASAPSMSAETAGADMTGVAVAGQSSEIGAAATAEQPAVSAGSGPSPPLADQLLPSMITMVQERNIARNVGSRLSVSIAPDELGKVSVTVERVASGATTIHVAAERLATLDLLRADHSNLMQALDKAGIDKDSHNLSFSWDGSSGGSQGWGAQSWGNHGNRQGARQPPTAASSYGDDTASVSRVASQALAATERGGIDVTA